MKPVIPTIVSSGNQACIITVSKMIPKYSSTRVWPIVFLAERGMFKLLNIKDNKARVLSSHSVGLSIVKNHPTNEK
jgi:hypothetical protein